MTSHSLNTKWIPTVAFMLASLAACTPKPVTDPRAAGSRYERWEVTVAAKQADVYSAALRVLTDSAYGLARTDALSGIIETRPRKESDAKPAGGGAFSMDLPITLRLLISPERGDSSRLSVAGDFAPAGNTSPDYQITARTGQWKFVQGIGDAILARVQK